MKHLLLSIQLLIFPFAFVSGQVINVELAKINGISYSFYPGTGAATVEYPYQDDTPYAGDIVIPESFEYKNSSYEVIAIGDGAFMNSNGLNSLVIPNSVKKIGKGAFMCSGIKKLSIPNSVTTIEEKAFQECSNLESLTISTSITEISRAFCYGCSSLKSITIPENVTSIGEYAFLLCSSLTTINIPNGVTSIGREAFWECSGLTSVMIPNSVTTIGDYAFWGCSSLTSFDIPEGVTRIENGTFEGCKSLTSIQIPSGITYIGQFAFDACSSLTSFDIPLGVTRIEDYTFNYCSGLTSINIHDGVTSIGNYAFDGCSGLTSIHIPDGVTTIERGAFSECSGLSDIHIPEGVTSIEYFAFSSCSNLKSIKIPEKVVKIGGYAFLGCDGLTSITIPSGVTAIGDGAFHSCKGLKSVNSLIENPFAITEGYEGVFSYWEENEDGLALKFTDATLYVPIGTKTLYESTNGWKNFKNIVEIQYIAPIDGEMAVNTNDLNGQDMSDNVIGFVYYNVGNSGYDVTDGSIVISQTTNMGQITNAVPGSENVINNFTGLIFKVAAGKGTIMVNTKTCGNAQLVVQVGDQTPITASRTEKGNIVVNYDVTEDTYVYIYAIIGNNSAPAMRAPSADEVRIYNITVSPGTSGISNVSMDRLINVPVYNLSGQQLVAPHKGINIINGKKVVKANR